MRNRLADLFFGLVGRLTVHVFYGYLRHHLARSRGKLAVAGAAGVAVGVGIGVALRRGSGSGGAEGNRPR